MLNSKLSVLTQLSHLLSFTDKKIAAVKNKDMFKWDDVRYTNNNIYI